MNINISWLMRSVRVLSGPSPIYRASSKGSIDMFTTEHSQARPQASKLVLEHVSKWFQTSSLHVHALDDVSLRIAEGEFVCLVGPSGCGKSTLLNIIAGLEHPDRGTVRADGQAVDEPGPRRLMMFQESALFPWLTVLGNVLFGLKLRNGMSAAERRRSEEHTSELHSRLHSVCRL